MCPRNWEFLATTKYLVALYEEVPSVECAVVLLLAAYLSPSYGPRPSALDSVDSTNQGAALLRPAAPRDRRAKARAAQPTPRACGPKSLSARALCSSASLSLTR